MTSMFTKPRTCAIFAIRPCRGIQTTTHSTTTTGVPTRPVQRTVELKPKIEEGLAPTPSEASIREIEEAFARDGQLPWEQRDGDWSRAGTTTAEYQVCSKTEFPYAAPGEDRRYGGMRMLREKMTLEIEEEEISRKKEGI